MANLKLKGLIQTGEKKKIKKEAVMGAVQQYLKYTLLNCCSLTQAWTGVLETGSCHFWMSLTYWPSQNNPPPLSFSDLTFYCYSLKAYTAISLLLQHHMAPAPSLPPFLGGVREMHNQCNIHEFKKTIVQIFFFFLPLFVRVLFLPLYI